MFIVAVVLVAAVLLGRWLTARLHVPDAAGYVLIGVAVAFLPGFADVRLSPDVVLLLFLPPLIYYAGFFSDPRETVDHIGPVVGQSVGLVLATAAGTAGALLLMFPDVGWPAALAFGAAVAPPDPVAATSVLDRLGVPRKIVTVLEAEGLINDGVAITVFGLAVTAVGMTPSVGDIGLELLIQIGGGIVIGLVVAWAAAVLRKRMVDAPSHVLLSLATPYVAFVPAQLVHASGVLATVTAAVWLGTRGRGLTAPSTRLQSETFWRVLNVLLVGLLFVLLGVQIPAIVASVSSYPLGELILVSLAVLAAAVLVRFAWVLLVTPLLGRVSLRRELTDGLSRRELAVLGWCGPRGAVSLAVILSVPELGADGAPFPRRDLLLFLTTVVVLGTLVLQVLPLPALLRWLGMEPSAEERTEVLHARRVTLESALRELDELTAGDDPDPPGADALRQVIELRRDRLRGRADAVIAAMSDDPPEVEGGPGDGPADERDLRLRLVEVERNTLARLRGDGRISARTLVGISQELDAEETRLRHRE